ncbi:MAG: riboflavin synthase [Planctomycetes bacterium]|nr:riboflavin synthase [Planctomycetota bacterium]
MFTGLVQSLAEVANVIAEPPGVRLVIRIPVLAAKTAVGDSIALNGCCLTVVAVDDDCLSFQAGEETLSRTNLGELTAGGVVNVEPSLRVGDAVGGHYVLGHVDAVGIVVARHDDADWCKMWYRAPQPQMQQMASKGSIAVDGVSLTLVDVEDDRFSVALIPHTLTVTTLGRRQNGDRVNLETDVLAKYVQQQLQGNKPSPS